jgi:serine/threonine protein kinase
MALAPGTKLGPYEIVSAVGAGGMGEVYRARDAALGRDVAIKVLPTIFAQDGDRLRRFKQEAQATAALNHPNILTIYHIGEQDGSPYIVSELLDGESLRQRLQAGALPQRKVLDYGVQVAQGLAAAHAKGIIHRDLKPENVLITRDGRAKILDFGLAKLTHPEQSTFGTDLQTLTGASQPGFVLGTVGYMSPEQVRGRLAGPASDLFSFGAILYEMLSGKRAFTAGTAAETMSAILNDDPLQSNESNRQIPPSLERIVRHCLEKNPDERFQSAHDLGFDLESITSSVSTAANSPIAVPTAKSKYAVALGLGLLFTVLVAGGAFYFGRKGSLKFPTYRRITFRQGSIQAARFTPDGQSVIYSAALEGQLPDIFTTRPQSPESRSMGLVGSTILSVSSQGEMAVLLQAHAVQIALTQGTLARVPLEGGVPREISANVESADWTPDGSKLLITKQDGVNDRLESPPGTLIYQTTGAIGRARFSPDGNSIAFFNYEGRLSDNGSVAVVDLAGHRRVLSTGWTDLTGLAWSPNGGGVWFSGSRDSGMSRLFAVNLKGSEREVMRSLGGLRMYDIARDGRVLLSREDWRSGIYGLAPGENHERDLSWFDYSVAWDLTSDGRTVLFMENGDSVGAAQQVSYLRGTDGSPALRISNGSCWAISHDGRSVLCTGPDGQLIQVPTRSGETKALTHDALFHGIASWFSDQKRVLFQGKEPGHGFRLYVQDISGGEARPVTPEGATI